MILKGSQRAGASALADHLLNDRENDTVHVFEIKGFVADDLLGALKEAHAISKATLCTQFMFSLSFNPPQDHIATEQELLDAVNRAEHVLGLDGQPRAIVIHEKQGRRHAHAVWSRIDAKEMKAINLPHFKTKLRDLSKELFLDHGWDLPKGLQTYGQGNPLNFTLDQWQQAKRIERDPREIKSILRSVWSRSDSKRAFANAIQEQGFTLAKGDRRGFVILDHQGTVYSLPRWVGEKSKDVKVKLGSPDGLPSVAETQTHLRLRMTEQIKSYIRQVKDRHEQDQGPLRAELVTMKAKHKCEREAQKEGQDKRWAEETKTRMQRINGGLRGLFDRMTGQRRAKIKQNEVEAFQCTKRDQKQRDELAVAQLDERQALQERINRLRDKQAKERQQLARSIASSLRQHSIELQKCNLQRGKNAPTLKI